MKDLHIIAVGKLNDKAIEELERDYFKRITTPKLFIHEVKSHAQDLTKEAKEVLSKIDDISKNENPLLVLMAEKGKSYDSVGFSKWLQNSNENRPIIFIIGGASGHGEAVQKLAHDKLSLSEMTFPHKLARLLLVEQIYRAQTIIANHPYNK